MFTEKESLQSKNQRYNANFFKSRCCCHLDKKVIEKPYLKRHK